MNNLWKKIAHSWLALMVFFSSMPIPLNYSVSADFNIEVKNFAFSNVSGETSEVQVTPAGTNDRIVVTVPYSTDSSRLIIDPQETTFAGDWENFYCWNYEKDNYYMYDSGSEIDFSKGMLVCSLTGDSGVKNYDVTVIESLSPVKSLDSFKFLQNQNVESGLHFDIEGVFDNNKKTVDFYVSEEVDRSSLTPSITYTGNSYTPLNQTDFSAPVNYNIYAKDGSFVTYTVNVNQVNYDQILDYRFASLENQEEINIDHLNQYITVTLPYGTNKEDLEKPLISVSEQSELELKVDGVFKKYTESLREDYDFDNIQEYRVTGGGVSKIYTVSVLIGPSPDKAITEFKFLQTDNSDRLNSDIIGLIDQENHLITFDLANSLNKIGLVPTITINGKNLSPASKTAYNFTQDVIYQVEAFDGTTQDYTVRVNSFPATTVLDVSVEGIEDQTTTVNGTDILIKIPYNTDKTSQSLSFDLVEEAEVLVMKDGVLVDANSVKKDFSNPITYQVKGGGISTDYQVSLDYLNYPPIVSDLFINFSEDNAYQFKLSDFEGVYSDKENDLLQKIMITSLPDNSQLVYHNEVVVGTEIDNRNIHHLVLLPDNNFSGLASFSFRAFDGEFYSETKKVEIDFENTNDAPFLKYPNFEFENKAKQDEHFYSKIPSDFYIDLDNDPLTYYLESKPDWLNFNSSSLEFSGVPKNEDVGINTFNLCVTDKKSAPVCLSNSLEVLNKNDAPKLLCNLKDAVIFEDDNTWSYDVNDPKNLIPPEGVDNCIKLFEDVDPNDNLKYSFEIIGDNQVSWLSFDSNTQVFSGTPKNEDVGIDLLTVKIIVNDSENETNQDQFTITIKNTNDSPVLVGEGIEDQTLKQYQNFYLDIKSRFKDPDNEVLNERDQNVLNYFASLENEQDLPQWLNFNNNTGTFSGKIIEEKDLQNLQIFIKACDQDLACSQTDDFYLRMENINDRPVKILDKIQDKTVKEDIAFTYKMPDNAFLDPDKDTLIYSAQLCVNLECQSLPEDHFIKFNSDTNTFLGTPSNDDVGEHIVRYIASDNEYFEYYQFKIIVENDPDSPEIVKTISDIEMFQDETKTLDVSGTFEAIDPDDSLVYSASLEEGKSLPNWISFADEKFIFSPKNENVNQMELITVYVYVTNKTELTNNTSFTLTVKNINDAPLLAEGKSLIDQNILQGDSTWSYSIEDVFTDPDLKIPNSQENLTYEISYTYNGGLRVLGRPDWLNFNNFIFSGVPQNKDIGNYEIFVKVRDLEGLEIEDSFNLTVTNINDNPYLNDQIIFGDERIPQNQYFEKIVPNNLFIDPDSDNLTLSAVLIDKDSNEIDLTNVWLDFDGDKFFGTPNEIGDYKIKLTADDNNGGLISTQFVISVYDQNEAPVVNNGYTIEDEKASLNSKWQFSVAPNIFSDPDKDVLTYDASLVDGAKLPNWILKEDNEVEYQGETVNTLKLSGIPTETGNFEIKITANDNKGGEVSLSFSLIVEPEKAIKTENPIDNQILKEDVYFEYIIPENVFSETNLDYELKLKNGDPLNSISNLSFNETERKIVWDKPSNYDVGNTGIELVVKAKNSTDEGEDSFLLIVENVNNKPEYQLGSLVDLTIAKNKPINYTIPLNAFTDKDMELTRFNVPANPQEKLSLSIKNKPDYLNFDNLSRVITGTAPNTAQTISITIVAEDEEGETVEGNFNIIVNDQVNTAPIIDQGIGDQTFMEKIPFTFDIPVNAFKDNDAGDILTYQVSLSNDDPLPGFLTFANSTFTGNPQRTDIGTYEIKVIAEDLEGESVSTNFNLIIKGNSLPNAVNDIFLLDVDTTKTFTDNDLLANDTDPDGDLLTVNNVALNPSNGVLVKNPDNSYTYTPNPGFRGDDEVSYTVTDTKDLKNAKIIFRVGNGGVSPSVSSSGNSGIIFAKMAEEDKVYTLPSFLSSKRVSVYNPVNYEKSGGITTRELELYNSYQKHRVLIKSGTNLKYCNTGEFFKGELSLPVSINKELDFKDEKILETIDFHSEDKLCFSEDPYRLTIRFYSLSDFNKNSLNLYKYDLDNNKYQKLSLDDYYLTQDKREFTTYLKETGVYVLTYNSKNVSTKKEIFTDLVNHWSKTSVEKLVAQNVLLEKEKFKPEEELTRAELSKLVVESFNLVKKTSNKNYYPDIKSTDWFADYVNLLTELNIVWGYPDSEFKPAKKITRAEALKMILLSSGILNPKGEVKFEDVPSSEWFASYVGFASQGKILNVQKNKFEPARNITRAETVALIVKTQEFLLENLKSYVVDKIEIDAEKVLTKAGKPIKYNLYLKNGNDQELKKAGVPVWCQYSIDNKNWKTYGDLAYTNLKGKAICEAKIDVPVKLYLRGMRRGVSTLETIKAEWQ